MQSKKFRLPRKKIAEFCKRWKITEFSVFGSVLRDDFNPDSDIDVLVSMTNRVWLAATQGLFEVLEPLENLISNQENE